jgi:hypothetical protein
MASNEEILQMVIIGIPRVAERIAELRGEHRESAFKAVAASYLQTLLDLEYAEGEAQHWIGTVMDILRAEVVDQTREQSQATDTDDGFASIERLMKLLVQPRPTAEIGGTL